MATPLPDLCARNICDEYYAVAFRGVGGNAVEIAIRQSTPDHPNLIRTLNQQQEAFPHDKFIICKFYLIAQPVDSKETL